MRKTLVIYQANAYVRLTDYKPELVKEVLIPFCKRNFYRFQKVPGELFGTTKLEVSHVFARFNTDKTELRFNASMLEPLIKFMTDRGYNKSRIEVNEEKIIPAKKVLHVLRDENIKPRNEKQEEFVEFMSGENPLVTNNMSTGEGKFQPLSSRIKVPGGWTTMGKIKPGDEVIAWDGSIVSVRDVYPQGVKDVYRFTFSDGRSAEAGLEHLWKVHSSVTGNWSIVTTSDIINSLEMKETVVSIPLAKPTDEQAYYDRDTLKYHADVYNGRIKEWTTDKSQATLICDLVRGLGGICSIEYTPNGVYTVTGSIGLEDKLEIVSVGLVRQEECKCISINHPDRLYVTDDYVVTHNTFCALYSSVQIGERILITVLPRYVTIWVKAFGEFYKIKPEEIMVADTYGVPELHKAILNGADPKIIILPLTKIDMYLKRMKEDPTVPCLDQVFNDLQCGVRIIDEAHESIYSVYMSLLYGNHKKTMALSATLRGDDDFINEIYNQLFPPKSYLRATEYSQYIHCIAYHHRIDMWKYKINTKGFGGYSHVKFEQGILKNRHVFEQYYQLLKGAFWTYYLENLREGQKSMWFFATVDFCEAFEKRLKKDYPELDTVVFTAKMSSKKGMATAYLEHQVVITTPGSCGTGKDIPMLYAVFSPIAVSSSQRNDQMVGRTRPVDKWWPDLDPIFVYFVCRDEPKQLEYDKKRRSLFGRKLKKLDVIDSGSRI